MTPSELDAIEALDKARTQGRWLGMYGPIGVALEPRNGDTSRIAELDQNTDWEFIAACSVAVPKLIAEVRRHAELIKAAINYADWESIPCPACSVDDYDGIPCYCDDKERALEHLKDVTRNYR